MKYQESVLYSRQDVFPPGLFREFSHGYGLRVRDPSPSTITRLTQGPSDPLRFLRFFPTSYHFIVRCTWYLVCTWYYASVG